MIYTPLMGLALLVSSQVKNKKNGAGQNNNNPLVRILLLLL